MEEYQLRAIEQSNYCCPGIGKLYIDDIGYFSELKFRFESFASDPGDQPVVVICLNNPFTRHI
jgi:hypothetical protein